MNDMAPFAFSGYGSTTGIASEWRTLETYRDFSDPSQSHSSALIFSQTAYITRVS